MGSANVTPFFILSAMHHRLVNIAYFAYFFIDAHLIWVYFVIDQAIPHTAACTLSEDGIDAYFAIGYQANVLIYKMNCATGQTTSTELKESNIVPRIFNNLTGAFRWELSSLSSFEGFLCEILPFYTIQITTTFLQG